MKPTVIARIAWTLFLYFAGVTPAASARTIIRNVHVLPMDRERILAQQSIVIEGNRITALGPSDSIGVEAGATVIEGDGRYLLPGLADMHVHLVDVDRFPVYLANGITTAANMNGSPDVIAAREDVASGKILGPRIFTTGPLVAGEEVRWKNKVLIHTPEEAERVVREQVAAGYDFIKVYDGLSAETYRALIAEAQSLGIRAIGHLPDSADVADVLSGQAAIHHVGSLFYYFLWPDLDVTRFPELAGRLAQAKIWVCPTLCLYDVMARITDDRAALENRPEMRFVTPATRAWWAKIDPGKGSYYAVYSSLSRRLIRALHDAGVPLLTGSDHPNPYVVPGFSLHDELEALVASGLSRFDALETVTANPGRFLRVNLGTVAVGQMADLLLVASNPLDDLSTLRHPEGVMVNGRWLDKERLAHMLAGLAEHAPASIPTSPGR